MRITKVKVKEEKVFEDNKVLILPEKMVLMHRKTDRGTLILDNPKTKGQNYANKTDVVFDKCKNDSFKLSLIKKTLDDGKLKIKRCTKCPQKGKLCPECLKKESAAKSLQGKLKYILEDIICKELNLPIPENYYFKFKEPITSSEIKEISLCLKHKFRDKITFKNTNGKIVEFNFLTDLQSYVVSKDKASLFNYTEWVKCYIRAKKDFTKRSIVNNRLVFDYSNEDSLSKRKKVLKEWGKELNDGNKINLSEYVEKLFGVGASLDTEYSQCLSSIDKDGKHRTDEDILKSLNFDVKKALQARQKALFGKDIEGSNANRSDDRLYVYFTEAVKYFEHYFPIKKKKGKKVLTMDDAKHYLEKETVKETIANQIENAVRLQLLQQGKSKFHDYNNDTSSSTLARTKRDEFFVLNLVEACAFASNNIRNIVDDTQVNDILGYDDLRKSIEKYYITGSNINFNSELFNQFYNNNELNENDSHQLEQTIWALRGSVQKIRNNIIHYKSDAIDKIFKIDKFEYLNHEDEYYTQTIFKNALAYDIDNLPQVFVEQLSSNDVLKYYSSEDIESFLKTCKFSLCRSSIPFAPGFKAIYEKGFHLQKGRASFALRYYQLDNYGENTKDAKAYPAFRFLLKLLYNNSFLPHFLDEQKGIVDFKRAVKFTLDDNKDEKQTLNKDKYAFKDIPYMSGLSIAEYMSNIHSLAIQEKNKKDEKEGEQYINTQKFIKKVFIKGFDNFLKGLKLEFLLSPIEMAKDDDVEVEYTKLCKLVNVGHNIDKNINLHIAFYTFCKLLDAVHLSDLRNELIKYKSSDIGKNYGLEYVTNIIELCILNVDRVDNKVADVVKTKWKEDLDCFVDKDIKTESELYIQSDNYTPVVHASIAVLRKYGTFSILQKLVEKEQVGKITKKDYEAWKEFNVTSPDNKVSEIERLMKEREELHKQWVDVKNGDKKKVKENIDKKTYLRDCTEIEKYNWLDNKLHLVHLKRLHNLTIQILSRLARFVALWDRDFIMFDSNLVGSKYKLEKIDTLDLFKKILPEAKNPKVINRKKGIRNGLKSCLKRNKIQKTDDELDVIVDYIDSKLSDYCSFFDIFDKTKIDNRNFIAHYNYISKFGKQENSIIDLIYNLRDLMQYDRKLRNAVTKSIINVFEQNGMILKLEVTHDKKEGIKVKSIVPKTIIHLGDKELTTPLVSKEYCSLCKTLLEMKK